MDAQKLKELMETVHIDDDVGMSVSALSDELLVKLAGNLLYHMIDGTENANAALGAYIALGVEAVERCMTRGKSNG